MTSRGGIYGNKHGDGSYVQHGIGQPAMKPTKEEYNKLADTLGVSLDHCNEASLYGGDLFTAHKALRLVANMPSEKELAEIIHTARWDDGDPHLVYKYPFSEADNSDREVCFVTLARSSND